MFGLSTDYGVFLLGRIKEEHDAGASPEEAVALGMAHTGGIVTAAACCLALALGALVLSRLVFVKEIGLGVAFAVILDATLVRAVMVPARHAVTRSGRLVESVLPASDRAAGFRCVRTGPAIRSGVASRCRPPSHEVMNKYTPLSTASAHEGEKQ